MKARKTKVFVALGVLALIVAVGAAWAYYGGSGQSASTQAASAGTAPRTVTVTVTGNGDAIYPGESNPYLASIELAGQGRAHIGSATAAIDASTLPVGCDEDWFDVSAVLQGGPQEIDSGNPANVTGSVTFLDENVLQDACSNAVLKIVVTALPTP